VTNVTIEYDFDHMLYWRAVGWEICRGGDFNQGLKQSRFENKYP
jgi:hypothetical protein